MKDRAGMACGAPALHPFQRQLSLRPLMLAIADGRLRVIRSRTFPGADVLIFSTCLVGCADRSPELRELELARQERAAVPPAVPTPVIVPDLNRCLPLWPTTLRLSGIVEVENRLGPPGYGETPAKDEKVTIFVLRLRAPVDVCAETSSVAPQPEVKGVRIIRLTGHVDPARLRRQVGLRLEVDGTLDHGARGMDFTQVLIRVDSIPGERRVPRRSAQRPEQAREPRNASVLCP